MGGLCSRRAQRRAARCPTIAVEAGTVKRTNRAIVTRKRQERIEPCSRLLGCSSGRLRPSDEPAIGGHRQRPGGDALRRQPARHALRRRRRASGLASASRATTERPAGGRYRAGPTACFTDSPCCFPCPTETTSRSATALPVGPGGRGSPPRRRRPSSGTPSPRSGSRGWWRWPIRERAVAPRAREARLRRTTGLRLPRRLRSSATCSTGRRRAPPDAHSYAWRRDPPLGGWLVDDYFVRISFPDLVIWSRYSWPGVDDHHEPPALEELRRREPQRPRRLGRGGLDAGRDVHHPSSWTCWAR